jgi:hypothetical protein
MVPRSELDVMKSRLLSLETFSKNETDRHQLAVDALQERLRTCMQENDFLHASLQAGSQQLESNCMIPVHPCDGLTIMVVFCLCAEFIYFLNMTLSVIVNINLFQSQNFDFECLH